MAGNVGNEQAKYDALVSSLADGIIIVDKTFKVIKVNEAFTNITGYSDNDIVGARVRDVITITELDGSPLPALNDTATKIALAKRPVNYTYAWTRKDGSKVVIESTASSFRINNKIAGSIIIIRDVSEQAALDSAKTEFVSLAAHQLRTPLSSVNWYLEMLSEDSSGRLSVQQKDYLSEVRLANKRMVALVNDLLNVSRIDLGTFEVNPEPADIESLVSTVLGELNNQIKAKNLHITTAFTGSVDRYMIDPYLALIIFQNLIGNAVKYTPRNGSVDIFAILDEEKLLITIDDTGYGIPHSQQNKIFNKLFRADNVVRRDTDGTGLGLYLVKEIVEKSGGTIDFSSKLNRGSTFSVTFPSGGMKRQIGGHKLFPTKSYSMLA